MKFLEIVPKFTHLHGSLNLRSGQLQLWMRKLIICFWLVSRLWIIALKMRKKKVESEDDGVQSSSKNEMVVH